MGRSLNTIFPQALLAAHKQAGQLPAGVTDEQMWEVSAFACCAGVDSDPKIH